MSGTEIALGILGSVSALYGFALAYYAFARSLHLAERDRYEREFREADSSKWQYRVLPASARLSERDFKVETLRSLCVSIVQVLRRAEDLNRFLLGAALAFVTSCVGAGWYLGIQLLQSDPWPFVALLGAGPVALAAIVAFVGAFVGYKNLRQTQVLEKSILELLDRLREDPYVLVEPPDRPGESKVNPNRPEN